MEKSERKTKYESKESRVQRRQQQKEALDIYHKSSQLLYGPVCHLLDIGITAIFGPQNAYTASHVQSICDTMEIPHLETRWDYKIKREGCLVNLHPHPVTLSKISPISRLNITIKKTNGVRFT
uniref:Uncharacterized protein n=1 Tax=Trichogramma kaykai TaxID=54128 RepID=A0ABD2XRE0_9HYME